MIVLELRFKGKWKVDRVLTNQRLNLIAGTEITSNVPKAWFLALVENRQEGKGNGMRSYLRTVNREQPPCASLNGFGHCARS